MTAPRWARRAYASRRSGWYPYRHRAWRAVRDRQAMLAAFGPCWRMSEEGRSWQAALTRAVNEVRRDA